MLIAQWYYMSRAHLSGPEQKQVTLGGEDMILRRKACGIEIRGEAATVDTHGKEIMPTFADEMVRIRP
jgi:hypothetical protein